MNKTFSPQAIITCKSSPLVPLSILFFSVHIFKLMKKRFSNEEFLSKEKPLVQNEFSVVDKGSRSIDKRRSVSA